MWSLSADGGFYGGDIQQIYTSGLGFTVRRMALQGMFVAILRAQIY